MFIRCSCSIEVCDHLCCNAQLCTLLAATSTTGSRLSSPQSEKRLSVCAYGPVEFNEGAVITDPLQKGRDSSSASADETLEIPLTAQCNSFCA